MPYLLNLNISFINFFEDCSLGEVFDHLNFFYYKIPFYNRVYGIKVLFNRRSLFDKFVILYNYFEQRS